MIAPTTTATTQRQSEARRRRTRACETSNCYTDIGSDSGSDICISAMALTTIRSVSSLMMKTNANPNANPKACAVQFDNIMPPLARVVAFSCGCWMLSYCLIGGTARGKSLYGSFLNGDKSSVPLFAVTLPILLVGLVATLGVRQSSALLGVKESGSGNHTHMYNNRPLRRTKQKHT